MTQFFDLNWVNHIRTKQILTKKKQITNINLKQIRNINFANSIITFTHINSNGHRQQDPQARRVQKDPRRPLLTDQHRRLPFPPHSPPHFVFCLHLNLRLSVPTPQSHNSARRTCHSERNEVLTFVIKESTSILNFHDSPVKSSLSTCKTSCSHIMPTSVSK